MDEKNFEDLKQGAKEAGAIMRGEMDPARVSSILPADQAKAVRSSKRAEFLAVHGRVDLQERTLELELGTGRRIKVPLSTFDGDYGPSGLTMHAANAKPDYAKFKLEAWGQGVSFGEWDSGIDTIVLEHDFVEDPEGFEKRYKSLLGHVGGAQRGEEHMARFRERLERQIRLKRGDK